MMATISADRVKELRGENRRRHDGVQKALTESNGDFEKAIDCLRQKGLATAAKKPAGAHQKGLLVHIYIWTK